MNVYLDIDGVLLANEHHAAHYADEFLQYILEHYPESTYWLTTHCWQGENRALEVLKPHIRSNTYSLIKLIKPAEWGNYKTDAIDFSRPFLWFDDDLFDEEEKELNRNYAFGSYVKVDLNNNQKQLEDFVNNFPQPECLTMFERNEIDAALSAIAKYGKAFTAILQKELRIGYGRAWKLMLKLESEGYIEVPRNGSVGKVYMDKITDNKNPKLKIFIR